MNSGAAEVTTRERNRKLRPLMLTALVLIGAGGLRVLILQRLDFRDVVWIVAQIPLAALLLMVSDYVHFKTRITVWVFLVLFMALALASSAFSTGLGMVLLGIWSYNISH